MAKDGKTALALEALLTLLELAPVMTGLLEKVVERGEEVGLKQEEVALLRQRLEQVRRLAEKTWTDYMEEV